MPAKTRLALSLLFIIGICALTTGPGWTQDAKEGVILARMKKDIFFLASDKCEGRGVGTKGLDIAADYIADQFKQAGLKPGGHNGTYFQPFPFATAPKLDGESTLVFDGPKETRLALAQGSQFAILGSSSAGKVSAPVVFVGYGVKARGIEYDDYAGLDVKGKVVIALRRLPRWSEADRPFDGANKDDLAAVDLKQIRAQTAKAAAVILVNDASETKDDLMPMAAFGISTTSIPFVQMRRAALDLMLQSSVGKSLGALEKEIDKDLKPRSAVLKDWTVTMDLKLKRNEVPVKNVIAVLEGKGPLANETIVVGAHYDHLGYGNTGGSLGGKDAKGKIHYGADDNGSGTTSVMELARRFGAMKNREGRRIVFMTFTAEERGLIGSRHYCRVEPLFPLKDTAAMFNLDMVGRVKDVPDAGKDNKAKPKLLALGLNSGKGFEDLAKKHNTDFDLVKDQSVFGASDHFSFYQQKIPVIFFWTGTHPEYHRPTDVPEKINVSGMKRVADYSERIISELAAMPKRPEFTGVPTTMKVGPFPKMGIQPDYTFGGKGVFVEALAKDGPADKAGMKKGDVIIEVAGKTIGNVNAYMSVLQTQKVGVALDVKILRDSKEMKLKVTPR